MSDYWKGAADADAPPPLTREMLERAFEQLKRPREPCTHLTSRATLERVTSSGGMFVCAACGALVVVPAPKR